MRKKLSTFDLFSITTCNMIGMPIFYAAGKMLKDVKSPILIVLCYIISGIFSLIFGLCYAELGATYPQPGGDCNYLGRAYSKYAGKMYSAFSLFVVLPMVCAMMCQCVAESIFDPADASNSNYRTIVMILLLMICIFIISMGDKVTATVTRVLTILKMLTIVYIVAIAVLFLTKKNFTRYSSIWDKRGSISGFKAVNYTFEGIFSTMFSYDGWNSPNFIANRAESPGKSIPRSIIGSIIIVVILYTLINISYVFTLTYDELLLGENAFLETYLKKSQLIIYPKAQTIFFRIIPVFGTLLGSLLVSVGIKDSILPANTPRSNRILYYCLFFGEIIILAVFTQPFTLLKKIPACTTLWYGLSSTALIFLRKKYPGIKRTFMVPLVIPYIASFIAFVIYMSTLINFFFRDEIKN